MKNIYGELEKNKKMEISKMRKLVTSKEFKEYQKNVILLNELEKKILELDELIYGDIDDINVLAEVDGYSFYWKFVISTKDKTITLNQTRSTCSRMSKFENKPVYSVKYNLFDIGLEHEEIIYTIRKLSKLKNDTIKTEILEYISKKEKGLNSVNNLEDIPEYVYLNYMLYDKKCKNIKYRKYELDYFFELLLGYIDIIDISLLDIGFEELKKNKGEYISDIERISSKITDRYNLPSSSEFIKKIKQDICIKTHNTIEDIMEIIKTIDEQLEDIKCKLQSYPEYLSLKDEYTKLLAKVGNFENEFFN